MITTVSIREYARIVAEMRRLQKKYANANSRGGRELKDSKRIGDAVVDVNLKHTRQVEAVVDEVTRGILEAPRLYPEELG